MPQDIRTGNDDEILATLSPRPFVLSGAPIVSRALWTRSSSSPAAAPYGDQPGTTGISQIVPMFRSYSRALGVAVEDAIRCGWDMELVQVGWRLGMGSKSWREKKRDQTLSG